MRYLAVLAILPCACALGGVWKDPKHYVDDNSFAGLRVVSESPSGTLNVLLTDDGIEWFSIFGTISGDDITLDFTSKGFGEVTATHAGSGADQTISFPGDDPPGVWNLADMPTAAFMNSDGVGDHVGVFFDPGHYSSSSSWAGVRFIAPGEAAGSLHMVGSDDGWSINFWYLQGSASGDQVTFDFTPKGGPADLTGTWSTSPAAITWPDGNAWTKEPPSGVPSLGPSPPPPETGDDGVSMSTMIFAALILGGGAFAFWYQKKASDKQREEVKEVLARVAAKANMAKEAAQHKIAEYKAAKATKAKEAAGVSPVATPPAYPAGPPPPENAV